MPASLDLATLRNTAVVTATALRETFGDVLTAFGNEYGEHNPIMVALRAHSATLGTNVEVWEEIPAET